jgi:hypothetical protein
VQTERSTIAANIPTHILLWVVLFLMCLGLGYPTLNRYDPRSTIGLSDTRGYYELATRGPAAVPSHMRFRVLVPFLTRPLTHIAEGRTGSWEPVFFGFLIVNSLFAATTAWLLILAAGRIAGSHATGLLSGAIYLLNFENSNLRLSGMIDSSEGCFLMAITFCLLRRRLWPLPVLGILGALAKETFVPFTLVFTLTWWFVSRRRELWKPGETLFVLSTGLLALLSLTVLQTAMSGHVVWPWQFGESLRAEGGHVQSLANNIFDRNLLYGFVWLLPIGLLRVKKLPLPWVFACASTAALDFTLVAWYGAAQGTAARALFSIAGPLLSLSVALYFGQPRTDGARHAG